MHPEPFDGDESPHSGPKPERRRILPRSLNPMAFLGRVRPRATGELDPLSAKLKTCSLLTDAGDKALALLIDEGEWFSLPGGALLDRNGENDRALFIVLTGSLGVLVTNEHGEEKLVATIQAGDTVGEMSMISGEPHSAAIMALRDSELVRVSPALFDKLTARHPSVLLNLSRILVRRLRDTTRRAATGQRPKTFALVPLQSGVNCAPLVRRLEASLQSFGLDAMRLDRGAAEESAEFFQRIERQHAFVLYEGDTPDSAWSQMCLRQADRILFVIDASQGLPAHALRYAQIPALKRQLPDVVMLHKDDRISVEPLAPLLQSAQATVHHHIRANRLADIKRLARVIAGRSVGIVLAGGGARGFAHLGVLEALKEMRVPFDFVGGSSMGSIIAAGVAMEWDVGKLTERLRQSFVENNPLNDFTLPLVSLVRGRKVSHLLKHHFGDLRIEEMPLNFFCVSSDLTTGQSATHRTGPVWRALRASVAIPGLLPPMVEEGHVLVDGGLMNNYPVDVLCTMMRGAVIGCDVSGALGLTAAEAVSDLSLWSMLTGRTRGAPSIVSILMRSGTVGNEAQRRNGRAMTDLLFDPPMPGINLQSWKAFDRAIEEGYRHAVEVLERNGLPPAISAVCG